MESDADGMQGGESGTAHSSGPGPGKKGGRYGNNPKMTEPDGIPMGGQETPTPKDGIHFGEGDSGRM